MSADYTGPGVRQAVGLRHICSCSESDWPLRLPWASLAAAALARWRWPSRMSRAAVAHLTRAVLVRACGLAGAHTNSVLKSYIFEKHSAQRPLPRVKVAEPVRPVRGAGTSCSADWPLQWHAWSGNFSLPKFSCHVKSLSCMWSQTSKSFPGPHCLKHSCVRL